MIIKDGTLVQFDGGELGIVVGVPRPEYERDLRGTEVCAPDVCEVRIVFPRGVAAHRLGVPITSLAALGQTKENGTADSVSNTDIEDIIHRRAQMRKSVI